MNKLIISIIVIAILGVGGYAIYRTTQGPDTGSNEALMMDNDSMMGDEINEENGMMVDDEMMDDINDMIVEEDSMMKDMDDTMAKDAMNMKYDYEGKLIDVTGGNSSGTARANYDKGSYVLLASFQNLPEPQGTDFYEGWIVNKSPLSVISTGKVEMDEGGYINMYSSGKDLTDHDFYVLTLEPDDGDPAPAKHIVEGVMTKADVMMKDDAMEKESVSFSGTVLAGSSSPLLDFNKADYDKAITANKKIALYFFANWCPTCKAEFPKMQSAFNQLQKNDVVGFRVNFKDSDTDDDETQLARDFGIAYQHTKVLLKDGVRILKAPESWDLERYIEEISKI